MITTAQIVMGLTWYLIFVFSTVLHEAAHAWAALKQGDPTGYRGGQVTLSPTPHLEREPVGMILVPWLSFLFGGWMMGWASCPYDPYWAQRHPRKAALMALAGPLANLSLVIIAGILIKVFVGLNILTHPEQVTLNQVTTPLMDGNHVTQALATGLSIFFYLNLLLFIFNLIPLPPLDGSAVVQLFLNEHTARRYQETVLYNPTIALMGIFIAWQVFGHVFRPVQLFALKMLYPDITYH